MKTRNFGFVLLALSGMMLSGCGVSAPGAASSAASTPSVAESGSQIGSTLLSSVLGGLVNKVITFKQENLVGTWNFKGADCKFESESFLQQAGGELAAATIENKANEVFAKFGIAAGSFSYTFNADGTYAMNINGRTYSGTYSYDESTCKLTLVGALGLSTTEVNLTYSGLNNISLLYDADKLLSVMTKLSALGSKGSTSTLSQLIGSYNGLKLGFELTK